MATHGAGSGGACIQLTWLPRLHGYCLCAWHHQLRRQNIPAPRASTPVTTQNQNLCYKQLPKEAKSLTAMDSPPTSAGPTVTQRKNADPSSLLLGHNSSRVHKEVRVGSRKGLLPRPVYIATGRPAVTRGTVCGYDVNPHLALLCHCDDVCGSALQGCAASGEQAQSTPNRIQLRLAKALESAASLNMTQVHGLLTQL